MRIYKINIEVQYSQCLHRYKSRIVNIVSMTDTEQFNVILAILVLLVLALAFLLFLTEGISLFSVYVYTNKTHFVLLHEFTFFSLIQACAVFVSEIHGMLVFFFFCQNVGFQKSEYLLRRDKDKPWTRTPYICL